MRTPAHIITYGETDNALVHITNANFYEQKEKVVGMQAKVRVNGERGNLLVKGSVGRTQLLPLAAAIAVAQALLIPLAEAIKALETYESPPGRSRLLEGKNTSIIIDDSYNASPAAVEEALTTLRTFPHAKRRIAVLGDMLELGRYSVMEHERIGALIDSSADIIVTVGIRARAFARALTHTEILQFENAHAAATVLTDLVRAGDIILVKGSQSIRMERIVEALLADPTVVSRLVRQEREWKRKA